MHRLNFRLLIVLVLSAAAVGGGIQALHAFQVHRHSGALLREADRAEQGGQPQEAVDFLRKYLLLAPDNTEALARLGKLLFDQHRFLEAQPVLTQVVQRDPNNAAARRELVDLSIRLARYQDAKYQLETFLLPSHPVDGDLLLQLGTCQQRLGESALAASSFVMAFEKRPELIAAYSGMAQILADEPKILADRQFGDALKLRLIGDTAAAATGRDLEKLLNSLINPRKPSAALLLLNLMVSRNPAVTKLMSFGDNSSSPTPVILWFARRCSIHFQVRMRNKSARCTARRSKKRNKPLSWPHPTGVPCFSPPKRRSRTDRSRKQNRLPSVHCSKIRQTWSAILCWPRSKFARIGPRRPPTFVQRDSSNLGGSRSLMDIGRHPNRIERDRESKNSCGPVATTARSTRGCAISVRANVDCRFEMGGGEAPTRRVGQRFKAIAESAQKRRTLACQVLSRRPSRFEHLRYRSALEDDPNLVPARLGLAETLRSVGRLDEAISEFKRLQQLPNAPPDTSVRLLQLEASQNLAKRPEDQKWQAIENKLNEPGKLPATVDAILLAVEIELRRKS